jgi:hypothetical protein
VPDDRQLPDDPGQQLGDVVLGVIPTARDAGSEKLLL